MTPVYTHAQWNTLLAQTITAIEELALIKGGEYAGDLDRLANFRRNGQALGLNPETIWAVYAGKHWDSIQQWIKDLQSGKERTRAESMEGRVHDLITYSILLLAMMEERNGPRPEPVAELEFTLSNHQTGNSGICIGQRNWDFVFCGDCPKEEFCENQMRCSVNHIDLQIRKRSDAQPT